MDGHLANTRASARQEIRRLTPRSICSARPPNFAYLGIAAGMGGLAYSASTGLTGRTPTDLSNPLHVVVLGGAALIAVWVLWLAVRLWRGR